MQTTNIALLAAREMRLCRDLERIILDPAHGGKFEERNLEASKQ
jgi:hypothetical protein